jgi:hypothetical protein
LSGIAQLIEDNVPGFNISDRSDEKEYSHNLFSGHKGTYFGKGMTYEPCLSADYIDSVWPESAGCKLVKSHDWAYQLDSIRIMFPNDWIMLVYRPDMSSYAWWHEAGGFNIKYPSYVAYKDSATMLGKIAEQNACILQFAHKHDLTWNYFTSSWIEQNFKQTIEVTQKWSDILVTLLK